MNNLGHSQTSNYVSVRGNRKRGFDEMILGSLDDTNVKIVRNDQDVLLAESTKLVCNSAALELKQCDLGTSRSVPTDELGVLVDWGNVHSGLTATTGTITGSASNDLRHAWSLRPFITPDHYKKCEIVYDLRNNTSTGKNLWCVLASHTKDADDYASPFASAMDTSGGKLFCGVMVRNANTFLYMLHHHDDTYGSYPYGVNEFSGTDIQYLRFTIENNIIQAHVDRDDGNGYVLYQAFEDLPVSRFAGNHGLYIGILDLNTASSAIDVTVSYNLYAHTAPSSSIRLCDDVSSLYKQITNDGPVHHISIPSNKGTLVLEQKPYELHIKENSELTAAGYWPIPYVTSLVLVYTHQNAICFNVKMPDLSLVVDQNYPEQYIPMITVKNMGPADSSTAQDIQLLIGNNASTSFDRKALSYNSGNFSTLLTEGDTFTFKADVQNNSWFFIK